MIIAMITVGMVQMAINQIIDVITMRHGFMSTAGAMHMAGLMALAMVIRCAAIRIFIAHLNDMLIDMVGMGMVQMTIMQIVDVVLVMHCSVSTVRAMFMVVIGVMGKCTFCHGDGPFSSMALARMRDCIFHQSDHVLVCNRIDHGLGLSAAFDQSGLQQNFQSC